MKRVSDICLIAPSEELARRARNIIELNREDIQVYVANLEAAADLVAKLSAQGGKVFISRRGTREFLEKHTTATIVNIQTMLSDYIEIMDQVRDVDGLVAFFSYEDDLSDDVKTTCHLLGIQGRNYCFKNAGETKKAVEQAIADGAKLGVGGAPTAVFSAQLGLRYLPLENSKESIEAAITVAKHLLEIKQEEEQKRERLNLKLGRYRAVFDFTHDAIISIDEHGCIDVINPVAEKLLRVESSSVLGINIKEVIPNTRMLDVLHTGEKDLGFLLNTKEAMLYANCIPIVINGRTKGVVSTFQDVKAIQSSEQKIRVGLHSKGLAPKYSFSNILGSSRELKDAISVARSYAKANATVLIRGETGTGKELFAQSICLESTRGNRPFVAINCATLDKNLLESELFGYVEGAFTGAIKGGKAGLFELAHQGTIFLDEIGELPTDLQAKLLRVLQEKEIRRLGSGSVLPIDVRIIAATNKNLEQAVQEKTFREDLFYRLNVLNLNIPPLRERRSDIYDISDFFLRRFSGSNYMRFNKSLHRMLDMLSGYSWPGNVRELQNLVERVSVLLLDESGAEQLEYLTKQMLGKERDAMSTSDNIDNDLRGWQRQRIIEALRDNKGSMSRTAESLAMSRTTLWRKLKEYNIET